MDVDLTVVFEQIADIEAWYECPEGCGFRASWDDPSWVALDPGAKGCPCRAEPPLQPVACNFRVEHPTACEHDGCDFSDCVMAVRDFGECPACGTRATLAEVKREPRRLGA